MNTAVLFLVFNRPDTTERVFDAIRKAKPPRLYIAADGPREGCDGEVDRVVRVREIATAVDWPCEVKTLFREENLGCKYAVSNAITWFFEQEEQGIILEDDCLPSQSFFGYCEVMLNQYRDDKRIWMIGGYNPRYPGAKSSKYFFSENPSVWGWACWADRWSQYDIEMNVLSDDTFLSYLDFIFPKYVSNYYKRAFKRTKEGGIDTWDYQLTLAIIANHGLVIKPKSNLISNLGVEGTHAAKRDHNHFVPLGELVVEHINFLRTVYPDLLEDRWFYQTRIKEKYPILKGVLRVLSRPVRLLMRSFK